MAIINKQGNVIAHCPGCDGGKSTYEYTVGGNALNSITKVFEKGIGSRSDNVRVRFQLFRCAGCGRGGLGAIKMMNVHGNYPGDIWALLDFYPEAMPRLPLPSDVPEGIQKEFREAELCAENKCYRQQRPSFVRFSIRPCAQMDTKQTMRRISRFKSIRQQQTVLSQRLVRDGLMKRFGYWEMTFSTMNGSQFRLMMLKLHIIIRSGYLRIFTTIVSLS
jgi:hypothetical protein